MLMVQSKDLWIETSQLFQVERNQPSFPEIELKNTHIDHWLCLISRNGQYVFVVVCHMHTAKNIHHPLTYILNKVYIRSAGIDVDVVDIQLYSCRQVGDKSQFRSHSSSPPKLRLVTNLSAANYLHGYTLYPSNVSAKGNTDSATFCVHI